MTRVAVVGNGGSGKTWLALQLAGALHVPAIHLDLYRYDASGNIRPRGAFRDDVRERLVQSPGWVADGNYLGTLEDRLAIADLVVLLDLPIAVCLAGILGRHTRHGGRRVEDASHVDRLDRGFLYYVLTFRREMRPRLLTTLSDSTVPVLRVRSRRQARAFADQVTAMGGLPD